MSQYFEELDYAPTPIGPVSLRRRYVFAVGVDVLEVLLGEEHLMSSLFTASELALGDLGVKACRADKPDVLVAGLGLGYTAQAALDYTHVARVDVVDYLQPIIRWHEEGLIPQAPDQPNLKADKRCRFIHGDFFALAKSDAGFDADHPHRHYDAVLIDIDHTPYRLLNQGANAETDGFYTTEGLAALARHLRPGGVVGLWSDEAPDEAITALIGSAFAESWAEPVVFPNPLQDNRMITQTVYLGRKTV